MRPPAASSPTVPNAPIAPRVAAPPVPPAAGRVQSPRAPAVAANVAPPRAPAVAAPKVQAQAQAQQGAARRWEDEPESDGWESAETVNSFPEPTDLPAPPPRAVPAVQALAPGPPPPSPPTQASPATAAPGTAVPATPASPGTMRGPYPTSPGVGEVAPVVAPVAAAAAAPPPVPASVPPPAATAGARGVAGPTAAARAATASPATAANAGLGSAMREEVWAIVRAAVEEAMGPIATRQRELEARLERAERGGNPGAAARLAAPASVTNPGGVTIPDMKAAAPYQSGASSVAPPARAPMASLPPQGSPQGYGVTVMASIRPTLDLDAVGAVNIDGFDGGQRKRRVAGVVVVVMLMIIIGAVTMTVISQS